VAEGGGLLNRYRDLNPYRGFESLSLRQVIELLGKSLVALCLSGGGHSGKPLQLCRLLCRPHSSAHDARPRIGVEEGKINFGRLNGLVAQDLLQVVYAAAFLEIPNSKAVT
jgi:hypothetical protein